MISEHMVMTRNGNARAYVARDVDEDGAVTFMAIQPGVRAYATGPTLEAALSGFAAKVDHRHLEESWRKREQPARLWLPGKTGGRLAE